MPLPWAKGSRKIEAAMKADREDELALRVAIGALKRAWLEIEPHYRSASIAVGEKPDGPVTAADRTANRLIASALQSVFPPSEYGYLSEEIDHGLARLRRDRVWIIDPIDGTHDFIERKGNFCLQAGLVRRWRGVHRPAAGVVYHPTEGLMYAALRGRGAWVEGVGDSGRTRPLRVARRRGPAGLRTVQSRSHVTPALVGLLAALQPAKTISMGSMGLKICEVAAGRADFYVNVGLGVTKDWDSCAPEAILTEAGGRVTDLRGRPLPYNARDPRRHLGILASNGACHEAVLAAIRAHFARPEARAPEGFREALGIG